MSWMLTPAWCWAFSDHALSWHSRRRGPPAIRFRACGSGARTAAAAGVLHRGRRDLFIAVVPGPARLELRIRRANPVGDYERHHGRDDELLARPQDLAAREGAEFSHAGAISGRVVREPKAARHRRRGVADRPGSLHQRADHRSGLRVPRHHRGTHPVLAGVAGGLNVLAFPS